MIFKLEDNEIDDINYLQEIKCGGLLTPTCALIKFDYNKFGALYQNQILLILKFFLSLNLRFVGIYMLVSPRFT